MKKLVYNFDTEGNFTGLWNDMLSDIDGDISIMRASEVEWSDEANGWIVQFLIGIYKGCFYPKVFKKRQEAIDAEIEFFNSHYI